MKLLLEANDECGQSDTQRSADLAKFDQIEPSFARFVFGNKRLRLFQHQCQVFLAKPRAQSELAQDKLQGHLLRSEDALVHSPIQAGLI